MQRVMVVDDLPDNVYLLRSMLESYGYAVVSAENGAQALELARANPPDIVISDILMPVMDGFTLCRQWRQDPLLWKIPFIFYTATYTDAKDAQFSLSLGANRFICKPAEPDVVVRAVQETLAGQQTETAPLPRGMAPEAVFLREYNETLIRKLEHKLDELEAANAELRRLDGIKNNLLSNVSHELRSPLVAVRGYTEMIGAGSSGPVSPQQREQCDVMLRNIDHLLVLIDNLLRLASGDQAQERLYCTGFTAAELITEVCDVIRARTEEKRVALHCDGGSACVYGDRRQLLQVLLNIADNAIKFTPPGGAITFTAASGPDGTRLIVSDTGIGIRPADLPHIFDRFYQADGSLTREQGGLGIGLGIAQEIVQRHGGDIKVASTPGQGATFTVELPPRR